MQTRRLDINQWQIIMTAPIYLLYIKVNEHIQCIWLNLWGHHDIIWFYYRIKLKNHINAAQHKSPAHMYHRLNKTIIKSALQTKQPTPQPKISPPSPLTKKEHPPNP
jgi:hypothetical protein